MNNKERFDLKDNNPLLGAPTARSGIFTTGASSNLSNSIDMYKSCIPHVPGSIHKGDLSRHLDMVVVFQTIELQRLSVEIQSLRVSLKDHERQIHNYRNYQVQIAELTEQCLNSQNQRDHYQQQLQKMSLACTSLYDDKQKLIEDHEREVQLLNRKFYSAEQQHQMQLGELKGYIEQLQNKLREKENYEKECQNKSILMQQQLSKLNQNIYQDRVELDGLKNEKDQLAQQLQRCMGQLRKEQEKVRDEMAKNRQHQENLQKFYVQNKQYERLIDNLNRQNTKLKSDLNQSEFKAQKIQREGQNHQHQVEEFKVRLDQNNHDLTNFKNIIEEERKSNNLLKNDLGNMEKAYDQIQGELKEREDKIMELIRGNEGLANQLNNQLARVEDLSQYIVDLNNKIDNGLAEIAKLKQSLSAYNQHIFDLEKSKTCLEDQLQMLQPALQMNNDLQDEVHQLKEKIVEKDEELAGKESYIQDITIQNKQLTTLGENLQNNLNIMNENIRTMENTINQERTEFQKIRQDLTDEFNNHLQKGQQQCNKLSAQLQQLREEGLIHEQTKQDLKILKEKCQQQAEQISNQQKRLEVIPKILSKLKELNSEHLQTQKSNQIMRQHLTKSVIMNQQLIDQIGSLLKEIQKLNEEIWGLQEKLISAMDKDDDFYAYRSERRTTLEESYPINMTPATDISTSSSYPIIPVTNISTSNSYPISPVTNISTVSNNRQSKSSNPLDFKKDPSPSQGKSLYPEINTSTSPLEISKGPSPPQGNSIYTVTSTYKTTRFSDDTNRNSSKELERPSSKERLSPYRKLPLEPQRAEPSKPESFGSFQETTSFTQQSGNGQGLTESRGKAFGGTHEGSRIKNIRANLTGGLANMGREGVFKSTLLGEGPLVESKKYLEPTTISTTTTTTTVTGTGTGFFPPHPQVKKFSGSQLPQRQQKKRSPSYQKFIREKMGK